MPRCQLERLQKYFRSLERDFSSRFALTKLCARRLRPAKVSRKQPFYFWLDTLCIPVIKKSRTVEHSNQTKDAQNQKDKYNLKMAAISRMTPIYVEAWRVLMLDSELLNVPSSTSSNEIYARIIKSAWAGRYWTLQESYLTQHLTVGMKGGFSHIRSDIASFRLFSPISLELEVSISTTTNSVDAVGYSQTLESDTLSPRDFQLINV